MPTFAATSLVFGTSAVVLVLEILAGRLLAPYVGVTLESFTAIIGTILAGIAVGSFVGGRAADRRDPRGLIGPAIIAGGVLAWLSIPIIDGLGGGASGGGATASVTLILTFAGFFAPAAVLSTITPMVVKLQLQNLEDTGSVVGRLSAIGTGGALFGTFLTGFLLVAALPTRPLIRGIGLLLVVIGVASWVGLGRIAKLGPPAMVLVLLAGAASFAANDPCEFESAYFCAFVVPDPDRASGRTLWLDTLRHSYVDLDDPSHLEFTYAQATSDILAAIAPPEQPLRVAHVGGGGLSLTRYLRATRPGTQSTVLELDPLLIQIAEDELGFVPGPDVEIVTGDARINIRDLEDNSRDLVIGDAFGGVSVPWHLTTVEFLEEVERVLTDDGVYVLNMIDYEPLGFARAEAATLADVFDNAMVFAPGSRLEGVRGGNFVMAASNGPLPEAAIVARNIERGDDDALISTSGFAERTATTFADFVAGARVLTDDFAPVDQLLSPYPPFSRNG